MFQRPLSNDTLSAKREKAAQQLRQYQQSLKTNYQDYISQVSEQVNDIESVSKPSMKSMPVQTKSLINKYKEQLERKPSQYVPLKKQPLPINTNLQMNEDHLQSVSSQQSEKPPNPFEQVHEDYLDQQPNVVLIDKFEQSNPNSLQYTQSQIFNRSEKQIEQQFKQSQMESLRDSSNLQELSHSGSMDSQQFYQQIEESQPDIQSPQKFNQNVGVSQSQGYSIKEEILEAEEDREQESSIHKSEQIDSRQHDSPDCESVHQESQVVENTYRWSQYPDVMTFYNQIPQSTAQFPQPQDVISEEQSSQSQLFSQAVLTNPIQKKISQELVVDMDKFESSKFLKSINKTQLMIFVENLLEIKTAALMISLHQEFKLLKKTVQMIENRSNKLQRSILLTFKQYKQRQQEKSELDRIQRKFRFNQLENKKQIVYDVWKNIVIFRKQQEIKSRKHMKLSRMKCLLNSWKLWTYNQKIKKQATLQYKATLFYAYQKAIRQIKKEDRQQISKFQYYNLLSRTFYSLKDYVRKQKLLFQKFYNAEQNRLFQRKRLLFYQLKQHAIQSKREKTLIQYAREANEYIPINFSMANKNVKIYKFK